MDPKYDTAVQHHVGHKHLNNPVMTQQDDAFAAAHAMAFAMGSSPKLQILGY